MTELAKSKAKSIDNGLIQAIYSSPDHVIFRTSSKTAGPVKLQQWFALKPTASMPAELLLMASEKKWKVGACGCVKKPACHGNNAHCYLLVSSSEYTSDSAPVLLTGVYVHGVQ